MLATALYLADQNPHRDRTLGVTRATRAIAGALAGRVELRQVVSASSVALDGSAVASTARLPFRTDRPLGRLVADAAHPALSRVEADVWFYPKGYAASPLRPPAPTLALVHDTILVHYQRAYPAARSRAAYAYWTHQLRATLRQADRVATVSQTAKAQILAYCDDVSLAPPPVDVVYAATPFDLTPPRAGGGPRFALHLASDAPHKRTLWLLDAWATLTAAGRDLPALTLVGRVGPAVQAAAAALPHVRLVGRVTDAVLADLLRTAAAVVVPSEIEGFGLPVLEAYASGTPACVTAGTALDEVLRAATDRGRFHLDDPATLAAALDDVLSMAPRDVGHVQARLAATYSHERLGDRVARALHATAR